MRLTDLPADMKGVLYTHVKVPYLLALTCKGMRHNTLGCAKEPTSPGEIIATLPSNIRPGHHYSFYKRMIKWLRSHRNGLNELGTPNTNSWLDLKLLSSLARTGNLDAMFVAVASGWVAFGGHKSIGFEVTAAAASKGDLVMFKGLVSAGFPATGGPERAAAAWGHTHVLEWIHERDSLTPWHKDAALEAAEHGRLETLTWLVNEGPTVPLESYMMVHAIIGKVGDDVIKWLRSMNCPHADKYDPGAYHDHLWGECPKAAANGDLPMLKWLSSNGYMRCNATIQAALQEGYYDIAEWAATHGFPPAETPCFAFMYFAEIEETNPAAWLALDDLDAKNAMDAVTWAKTYCADRAKEPPVHDEYDPV